MLTETMSGDPQNRCWQLPQSKTSASAPGSEAYAQNQHWDRLERLEPLEMDLTSKL